jgi:dihydroneopterin aldolase
MDKIIITDLESSGIIGVKHPERDNPQTILVNLVLEADLRLTGETDSLSNLINYSTVSKFVLAEVASSQFYTVEALSTHLAKRVLQQFAVEKVRIRVEKPKVVAHTARVGVEIKRSRKDFEF